MTTSQATHTAIVAAVLSDVVAERQRQDAKWGEQNHHPFLWLTVLMEEVGELSEAALHREFGGSAASGLRAEAIQVAAVAVAMVECLDRAELAALERTVAADGEGE